MLKYFLGFLMLFGNPESDARVTETRNQTSFCAEMEYLEYFW